MTDINKSNIEMKGELTREDSGYYARRRADALFWAGLLFSIAAVVSSVAYLLSVVLQA